MILLVCLLSQLPVLAMLAQTNVTGESHKAFNYQAALRDADGAVLKDRMVSIQLKIHHGDPESPAVYTEKHLVRTDDQGMIRLKVGKGLALSGDFGHIEWQIGEQWLAVGIDQNGGDNYVSIGASEILSVPVAIHAKQAEQLVGGIPKPAGLWHEGHGKPALDLASDGDYYLDISNGEIFKRDGHNWVYRGTIAVDGQEENNGESRGLDDWLLAGNAGTTPGTDFVGTTDANDLVFKTNNTEHLRIKTTGDIHVGSGLTRRGPQTDLLIGHNGDIPQLEFFDAGKSGAIRYHENVGFLFYTNGGSFDGGFKEGFRIRNNTDVLFKGNVEIKGSSVSSNQVSIVPLWQAGSNFNMSNTSGADLNNVESGLDPTVYEASGDVEVRLVIRITSTSAGTNNFQLRAHDGTTEFFPIVNTDSWTFASTQSGIVAISQWKDWAAGTNAFEVHLYGWVDAGSTNFNSAYLMIRPDQP